jgi:hypothetical protein
MKWLTEDPKDDAEGKKMENRTEEDRKEEDRMLRDSYQDMEQKTRYTAYQKNLKTVGEGKRMARSLREGKRTGSDFDRTAISYEIS